MASIKDYIYMNDSHLQYGLIRGNSRKDISESDVAAAGHFPGPNHIHAPLQDGSIAC